MKAYALANDVAVPDADVTDAIVQLETNLGGADALEAQLSGEGLTRNDLQLLAAARNLRRWSQLRVDASRRWWAAGHRAGAAC